MCGPSHTLLLKYKLALAKYAQWINKKEEKDSLKFSVRYPEQGRSQELHDLQADQDLQGGGQPKGVRKCS